MNTPLGEVSHKVTSEQIRWIRDRLVSEGRTGDEIRQGVRTEVHLCLQEQLPFPGPDDVTEEHRRAADTDHLSRMGDIVSARKGHAPGLHWLQKQHGMALWAETDRLVVEAGV